MGEGKEGAAAGADVEGGIVTGGEGVFGEFVLGIDAVGGRRGVVDGGGGGGAGALDVDLALVGSGALGLGLGGVRRAGCGGGSGGAAERRSEEHFDGVLGAVELRGTVSEGAAWVYGPG